MQVFFLALFLLLKGRYSSDADALSAMPDSVQYFLKALVCMDRIVGFLQTPDVEPTQGTTDDVIRFENACVTWPSYVKGSRQDAPFTLDLAFEIPKGITLVCGPVGEC